MIELKNVTFRYDGAEKNALDDISCTIEKGSITAVIGRNGSGKSTLAKLLNAILLPSAGQIIVDGLDTKDEKSLWEIRRKAGIVFQNPDNQIIAAVVEDDVAFGPENLGLPVEEIRRRVDDALADCRLTELRNRPPHLLSGGQKQRVAIAGILAMRPDYLILDEATAMLDPLGRAEVMAAACRLNHEQQISVILITHFMEEAAAADNVIVLDEGKIAAQGSAATVLSDIKLLDGLGLDAPLAAKIAAKLRGQKLTLPAKIVTNEKLAEALKNI